MCSFTYKETKLREQGIDENHTDTAAYCDPNYPGANVYLSQDARLVSSIKGVHFLA